VNYSHFYYLFYYGLDFRKTVRFWVFGKITSLVKKHIGLWNIPLDKCIKWVICSFKSFLNMSLFIFR